MKLNRGFVLRKLGSEYMAVAIGETGKTFHGMIRMNETGAWLWSQLQEDISKEELADRMCAYYENLDRQTAKADLDDFLRDIAPALEK